MVYLGYADSTFVPDEVFDEQTSKMLNTLYIDYGIDTKSEITPTEQVLINQKQDEIELLENTVSDGGTTLSEVNNKKKLLDDAKENATKENAAWQEEYYFLLRMFVLPEKALLFPFHQLQEISELEYSSSPRCFLDLEHHIHYLLST